MVRGGLSVRINSGGRDVHVTSQVSGLSFSKRAQGGHASASLTLTTDLGAFTDLGANDRVWIYDTATGRQVWAGYTEAPTPERGNQGERYQLTALGGYSLCLDQSEALPYLQSGADGWRQDAKVKGPAAAEVSLPGPYPSGDRAAGGVDAMPDGSARQALLIQWPQETDVKSGDRTGIRLHLFEDAATMVPGAIVFTTARGATVIPPTPGGYEVRWTGDNPADLTAVGAPGWGIFAQTADTYPTPPPATRFRFDTRTLAVELHRSGADVTIPDDQAWVGIDPPLVYGQLLTKAGARIDMATYYADHDDPVPHLLASDVVADLVGRLLTHIDPARTTIAPTTYPITSLSYPGGVTADGVLSDLAVFEPDMLFEVLDADESTGLHAANYRAWPTSPRYAISTEDGYVQPGGDNGLVNRIAVYWADESGIQRVTIVTVPVPELATPALGPPRIRDADPYTLPDGLASAANALRWGQASLEIANRGTRSGTATVARPIRDLVSGAWVQPWQIEPGYLVQVMETQQVHRLTEVAYDDASCASVLTLDDPVLTDEQRLAVLTRRGMTPARQTR